VATPAPHTPTGERDDVVDHASRSVVRVARHALEPIFAALLRVDRPRTSASCSFAKGW
jgi:hypothetical protein